MTRDPKALTNVTFGELNKNLNFLPRTEAGMVQQSLKVLANYRHTIPHDPVEAWVDTLGTDAEPPSLC